MLIRGLRLVLLGLVAWPTTAVPAAADRPEATEVQEILVEIAIGNLVRRTVVALEESGQVLVPALDFFDLIDLPIHVDSAGRLSAVRYPQEIPIFIDPVARTASAGDSSWAISDSDAIWQMSSLYVALPVLAELLEINFHVDWSELRITVTNPGHLPIARRIARERARRAAAAPFGRIPDHSLGLQRPRWDGAVFDWTVFYPGGSLVDELSYRAGLGLNIFGGSLELRHEDFSQVGSRTTASWLGVWPEKKMFRQVGVGDVTGTGPRPTRVRGAFVTNSPFVRPAFFDQDVLRGDLPPGWEIELYRNGQLVDYTQSEIDGGYQLLTPLDYGPNPLELRAYGPSGQVQTWERTVPVGSDRLPPGLFEYGVAAGECWDRLCDATANLDLHYGVSNTWTVRGGIEAFGRDTLSDLFHPYASVSGTVNSRWIMHGRAMWNGFVGGDVAYAPNPDLRIGAAATVFDTRVEAPLLTPLSREREFRGFAFWRPIPRLRALFFEASAMRLESRTLDLFATRIGGSFQTGVVRWKTGFRRERMGSGGGTTTRTVMDLVASANLRSSGLRALNGLFLQAGVEFSREGFQWLEWVASRPLLGPNRIDARISWRNGYSEPSISLGVTAFLPAARTITGITRTPDNRVQAQAFAEGSVIWNGPAGQVNVAPDRSLRRGGLGGTVFLDSNGNGRYDGDDEALEGVRLQVGPYTLITDEHGRFAIWDLVPFVPTDVALDSMSLNNPLWVPTFSLATVMVSPNIVRNLDVPVLPAAEVAGRVGLRTSTGLQPLSGLRLQIVNRTTGRRHEVITFHDGEFYLLGLTPGEYEVSIPEWTREALGVSADQASTRFRVVLEDGWAEAPYIEIELTPQNN
jgi:hypothetical protein